MPKKHDKLGDWTPYPANDYLSLPSPKMMEYILEHKMLDAPNLALHTLTTRVVSFVMAEAIKKVNDNKPLNKQWKVDTEIGMETDTACHATREHADKGRTGASNDDFTNQFMQTEGNDDLDYALEVAKKTRLPAPIIDGIYRFRRNVNATLQFPEQTLGPNNPDNPGVINWTYTVPMLASWLVANGITTIEHRFNNDLIPRRSTEIGNGDEEFGKAVLERYRDWGLARLDEFCVFISIKREDFYEWLRGQVQKDGEGEQSDQLIQDLFGRERKEGEFLPTSPLFQNIAHMIAESKNNSDTRKKLERIMRDSALLEQLTGENNLK